MANFYEHKIHELTEENKRLEISLKNSDEMLKSVLKNLENEVFKRYKISRDWFLVWVLTNIAWWIIK